MFLLGYRKERQHFLEYLEPSQLLFYSGKDGPIEDKTRTHVMRYLGNSGNIAGKFVKG